MKDPYEHKCDIFDQIQGRSPDKIIGDVDVVKSHFRVGEVIHCSHPLCRNSVTWNGKDFGTILIKGRT